MKFSPSAFAVILTLTAGVPLRAQAPDVQNQGSGPGYEMIEGLLAKARAAIEANDADLASKLASELLAKNTDKASWNYGNVVYEANDILGRAALRKGDVVSAKAFLIAAGKTPGSPQLDSFGPEMELAQELLAKGEKETVLEFLDLVAKFWATPKPGAPDKFADLHRQHAATIEGWKSEIRARWQPKLDRFDFGLSRWTNAMLISLAVVFGFGFIYRRWQGGGFNGEGSTGL